MEKYDHTKVEKKWQEKWGKEKLYSTPKPRDKMYILDMFPYPSGDGLHVGHVEGYTATDVYARYFRMQGKSVLHPMGWDAFGLPAENFAIKTGIHPEETTKKASDNFRRQIKSLGLSYDWSREIDTHKPEYYKWTQWLFLKLFENNLAYKKLAKVNWCDSCKTVLANEQVINGECERCGGGVVQKDLKQWFFRTTAFADELHNDIDTLDWPESTKTNQKNWIGKSEGALLSFEVKGSKEQIEVFTTRPDTLFGATYMVLAPDHPLVGSLSEKIENKKEVEKYQKETAKKTDLERTTETKEKTGVVLEGLSAINPATKEEIPIFIADYVLLEYGTGAIMAVPAHDERDNAFARKFDLPIREVVIPNRVDIANPPVKGKKATERHNVHAIVRDPKNDTYLFMYSPKFKWTTLPMGGVKEGEDVVEAAKREVEEESGFTNLKYVRTLGGVVRAEYFATHKDENRIAYTQAVMFDLVDHTQVELSEKEKAENHEIKWLSKEDIVYPDVVHAELGDWLERWEHDAFVYTGEGILVDSGKFTGLDSESAKRKIAKSVGGEIKTTYKLRDWLISRQRYWGVPIPVVYDPDGNAHAIEEKHLPWLLPTDVEFKPKGTSPLAESKELKERVEKLYGKGWTPEVDTMDTFVCSSWYFLRFADPHNEKEFAGKKELKNWLPVDMYMGGAEHTVLHLMYARFITKALKKFGHLSFSEPFTKLRHQGIILAPDGRKMSKSLGNVINPDDVIKKVGADTLRLYEMFMGPIDQAIPWNTDNMVGLRRFVERVWRLREKIADTKDERELESLLHKTIKKAGEDIENMKFNTAISALMIFINKAESTENISENLYKTLLLLLAPFAPHVTEELWEGLKESGSIHGDSWPKYDETLIQSEKVTIVVQINGKVRSRFKASVGATKDEVLKEALELEKVREYIGGKNMAKTIHIPDKLINIVV